MSELDPTVSDSTSKLTKEVFNQNLTDIAEAEGRNRQQLLESIKNPKYLEDLHKRNPDVFSKNIMKIVQVITYDRLAGSGKIIFLIDGSDFNQGEDKYGRSHIDRLHETIDWISEIVHEFGNDKQYCFVVTKADIIEEISDYVEETPQFSSNAKEVEDAVYDCLLEESHEFHGLVNKIDNHPLIRPKPINFFLISVDKGLKTSEAYPRFRPWRLGSVVKFMTRL